MKNTKNRHLLRKTKTEKIESEYDFETCQNDDSDDLKADLKKK